MKAVTILVFLACVPLAIVGALARFAAGGFMVGWRLCGALFDQVAAERLAAIRRAGWDV